MAYVDERVLVVENLIASRITAPPGGTLTIGAATLDGAATLSAATAISGALTLTGAVTTTALQLPSTAGPTATGAVTAAMSGRICILAESAQMSLPSPTGNAGVWYTFVCGTVSAAAGIGVVATSTLIQGKVSNAAAAAAITDATTITNSHATDIVGDFITIVCDGTKWWVTAQSGTWAGS